MRQTFVFFALLLSLTFATTAPAQWVQTNGPSDGDIHSLAVIGANTPTPMLFAGTGGLTHGAVYRTTDNGANWTATSTSLTGVFVTTLAVTDTNSATPMLFAGTLGGGVFSSSDSGTNWTAENTGLTAGNGLYIQALAVSGVNSPTPMLFAGTGGTGGTGHGVFRSSDNGASWTAASTGLSGLGLIIRTLLVSGANSSPPVLFAGTDSGVFVSTDSGSSWTAKSTGLPSNGLAVYGLAEIGANTSSPMLFAGTWGAGVFRSTDSGASWMPTGTGLTANGDIVYTLLVTGANSLSPTVFAGTQDGVFLSSDNGAHWTAENTGLTSLFIRAFAVTDVNSSSPMLFLGIGGGGAGGGVWRRPLSEMVAPSSVAQTPSSPPEIQSYPNPFSQSTTITFTSEAQGYADVRVVNLLGVEVARIFSGELSAGEHSFRWDANGALPGMYECILRLNGSAERVPMIYSR